MPFAAQPVVRAALLPREFVAAITGTDEDIDALRSAEIVVLTADVLTGLAGGTSPKDRVLDFTARGNAGQR